MRSRLTAPVRILSVLGVVLTCVACVAPAVRFSRSAASFGMQAEVVEGAGHRHVIFESARGSARTLHVYIDGDGTPWRWGRPTADPTPRNALTLRLMALDPAPSVYLGRPCYHGLAGTPPCAAKLWTAERYSADVVASMAAALRHVLRRRAVERLVWFGYSGGGALAALLAPKFPETADLVTVAANLDVDGWTDFHGYSRLTGSLNPATQPPLPPRIRQRHYVGGRDRVVPVEVTRRGSRDPSTVTVIPSYDHVCCWGEIWPTILADVEASAAGGR